LCSEPFSVFLESRYLASGAFDSRPSSPAFRLVTKSNVRVNHIAILILKESQSSSSNPF
jgi:hypothetical protein